MMGPQYMRSIIGADKLYANYNILGTIQSISFNNRLSKVIPDYSKATLNRLNIWMNQKVAKICIPQEDKNSQW